MWGEWKEPSTDGTSYARRDKWSGNNMRIPYVPAAGRLMSFTVLGLVMSPLFLSPPIRSARGNRVEWARGTSGERHEVSEWQTDGAGWGPVDEWRVDGRSLHVAACVTGGTRVTVRPSLYVSFPFSRLFHSLPAGGAATRFGRSDEATGKSRDTMAGAWSGPIPSTSLFSLRPKGRLRRWEEGDVEGMVKYCNDMIKGFIMDFIMKITKETHKIHNKIHHS